MAEFGWGEILILASGLLAAGALAGLIAGLFGVGGAIVTVPAIYHLLETLDVDRDIGIRMAVATSLAVILATGFSSTRAHWKRDSVDKALLRSWGPAVAVGGFFGGIIGGNVPGEVLTALFAAMVTLIALRMLLTGDRVAVARERPRTRLSLLIPAAIGLISVMIGVGGGSLVIPTLTAFGFPIRRAVGTAAAIGFILSIPGILGFIWFGLGQEDLPPFSLGYVSLVGLALILPTSISFAPLGARLAHTLPPRLLHYAFALFLGANGIRMGWNLFT